MINRQLIRYKVLQILYAFYCKPEHDAEAAEKELEFALQKSYTLYLTLLSLLCEVQEYAATRLEALRAQHLRGGDEPPAEIVCLAHDTTLLALAANEQLIHFREREKETRDEEAVVVQKLFAQATAKPESGSAICTEGARMIFRKVFAENEYLAEMLEQQCIYWNDDRYIVDSFVDKTLKNLAASARPEDPLLPAFAKESDHEYALLLLRESIRREAEIREYIRRNVKSWAYERVALMDILISQVATVEILCCPTVPVPVSVNEYVEMAKSYSTPDSSRFINGVLGGIVAQLRAEGKILK